jgi:hypothetical protein
LILKGYFSMSKKTAFRLKDFHTATSPSTPAATCPQFLWINLCGIAFPQSKSLIFIREIFPMKISAAWGRAFADPAQRVSSHFLWTKLCASARSGAKPLDS